MSLLKFFLGFTNGSMGFDHFTHSSEVKNVVFIGLTQNGKSTLIRSLLTYGGLEDLAKKIVVGDNNSSTTTKCSEYSGKAKLKRHTIRSKSQPEAGPIEPDEDLDMSDFTVDQIDTHRQIHLNLIDTPGLSDSNNPNCSSSNMNVLDERHKLGIMVALSTITHVHAVCFVVTMHETYSDSFKKRINELVRLFELSFGANAPKVNYHVIHTWVTIPDRFPDDPQTPSLEMRKAVFNENIKMGRRARHHFIDSTPHEKDLLGQYFCKKVMSELLETFSTASGVSTTSLTYPRDGGHVVNDKALQGVLRDIKDQLEKTIDKARTQIAQLEEDKKPFKDLDEKFAAQKQELISKIEEYDTWELVQVGGGSDSIETKWHQLSMIFKRLEYNSSTIIRDVKKDCTNGTFDCENRTEKSYSVYLNTINYSRAYGTVKIFSYKSDVYAGKIKELREDISEIDKERQTLAGIEITRLDEKIQKCKESINATESQVKIMVAQLDKLKYLRQAGFDAGNPPPFSVKAFGDKLKYFTVDNLYAASTAYQMSHSVPRTFLPPNSGFGAAMAGLKATLQEQILLASQRGKATTALEAQIRGNEGMIRVFELLMAKMLALVNRATEQLDGDEEDTALLPAPVVSSLSAPERKALRVDLEVAEATASREHVRAGEYMTGMLRSVVIKGIKQVEELGAQLEQFETYTADLRSWVGGKRKEADALRAEKAQHLLTIKAMRRVQDMMEADKLSIGAFAVVLKGINNKVANPYLELCSAIRATIVVEELEF